MSRISLTGGLGGRATHHNRYVFQGCKENRGFLDSDASNGRSKVSEALSKLRLMSYKMLVHESQMEVFDFMREIVLSMLVRQWDRASDVCEATAESHSRTE
jgi:hypothetical protein